MEGSGSLTPNVLGRSQNLNLGLKDGPVSVGGFVSGSKPNGTYGAAGANLGLAGKPGGVSVSGATIPNFGHSGTASVHINPVNSGNHQVSANAFTTRNHPTGPMPNYSEQGGGVSYSFKNQANVSATAKHIPIARQTEHSIGASVNLHRTPTSSLDLNAHTRQVNNAFGRSPWQHGGSMSFTKKF